MALDDDSCKCPFCVGHVPLEIVEKIKAAAAAPMSRSMNLAEFREWLDGLGPAATTSGPRLPGRVVIEQAQ